MKRKTSLPLLLSPAGGEAAFMAAVAAGADAVYLGGNAYNARAYAENFDEETLARCIALAHAHGVGVHVTLNTLLTDKELSGAVAWAERLWAIGADALICADVGLISILREHLPDMPIHASTQLSLHSTAGAEEISDLGFETVVMAREMDRDNLAHVCDRATATIESFAHGALCVSYSGQCLFSSLVGGRSGNRGACAQPCRLPYGNGYPLSLKDLSLASHIPSLLETGVSCLKIEGRMKSPSYVWGVTRIYRRLLDEGRAANEEEKAELARIFSRSGFTDGYYTGKLAGMTGVRREEDKQDSRHHAGQDTLSRTIDALRRESMMLTTEAGRVPVLPFEAKRVKTTFSGSKTTALFMQGTVWDALSDTDKQLFDVAFVPLWEYVTLKTPPAGVWLPPVIFDSEEACVLTMLDEAKRAGAVYALCGNPAQVKYAKERGYHIVGDFRLNITNAHAARYWHSHGVEDAILSPELTPPQMRDIGGRAIVYGRIPLMLTERCYASASGQDRCKTACEKGVSLTDRRGVRFPVMRMPEHRNIIFNSLPTYMGDKKRDIPPGVQAHFIFSIETAVECNRVIQAWRRGETLGCEVRRFTKPQTAERERPKSKETSTKQGSAPRFIRGGKAARKPHRKGRHT